MPLNEGNVAKLTRAGQMNLAELQQTEGNANNADVTIQDWGACYSSDTNQLSQYCTVAANSPTNPITGAGMLAYSPDGTTLYAAQYSSGFSGDSVAISVGTNQYSEPSGSQLLCIVYGWTETSYFFFSQRLTVVACDY